MTDLREFSATVFRQTLSAMRGQLSKAFEHANATGREPGALLEVRLAPDMFPLSSQIQFSCGLAKECFARLAGDLPEPASEVRTTVEALKLIDETLEWLDALPRAAQGGAEGDVTIALPIGMTFDLVGNEYVRDWALPQFYFHALMVYAILRSSGVPLGKGDYVPHMARYLRRAETGTEVQANLPPAE